MQSNCWDVFFLPDKPPPGHRVWDDGICQRSVHFQLGRVCILRPFQASKTIWPGGPGWGNTHGQVQMTKGNQSLLSCTLSPAWLCLFISLLRRTCDRKIPPYPNGQILQPCSFTPGNSSWVNNLYVWKSSVDRHIHARLFITVKNYSGKLQYY